MKTYFIFLLVFLYFISCKCIKAEEKINSGLIATEKRDSKYNLFKIVKIDSIENVYLIYAKKNDSIFKIASKKMNMDTHCNSKLITDSIYRLKIKSVFADNFNQRRKIAGVEFNGTMIKLKEDGVRWDLFVTDNIKGLCFLNSNSKSD